MSRNAATRSNHCHDSLQSKPSIIVRSEMFRRLLAREGRFPISALPRADAQILARLLSTLPHTTSAPPRPRLPRPKLSLRMGCCRPHPASHHAQGHPKIPPLRPPLSSTTLPRRRVTQRACGAGPLRATKRHPPPVSSFFMVRFAKLA